MMEPVSVTRAYTSTGGLALCGQSGRADPAVVGPLVRRMAARMRGACAANLKARRHSPLTSIDRGTGSLCGHARSPLFAFWSLVSGLIFQRQRRCVFKPRVAVARPLPWVIMPPNAPTATRLRPVRRRARPHGRNRVAVQSFRGTPSQGRPHCIRPTLG